MAIPDVEKSCLIVVDVQDRLYRAMHEKEALAENIQKLIKGVRLLGVPVIATEQYPQGIGSTIEPVAALLAGVPIVPKLHFSCCGDAVFLKTFKDLNRKQVLIAGIECHVCVYQTAVDLLDRGHEVHVVADAVSSRTTRNLEIGLQGMRDEGAKIAGTETVLFALLKTAGAEKFPEVLRIVK
ncbi:MAG TPA: hydrolase [Syntrophales bacterium]|nr:hydrolase [Syntrophales bacterium]